MKQSFWPKNWWVFGAVLIAVGGCLTAILYPVILSARPVPAGTLCLSKMKQVSTATAIYLSDSDDRMPLEGWITLLHPYTKSNELTDCPEVAKAGKHFGYAYKFGLSGLKVTKIEDTSQVVMFFETDALAKNVVANLAARSKSRHDGVTTVGFMDTHAKRLPSDAKLK